MIDFMKEKRKTERNTNLQINDYMNAKKKERRNE